MLKDTFQDRDNYDQTVRITWNTHTIAFRLMELHQLKMVKCRGHTHTHTWLRKFSLLAQHLVQPFYSKDVRPPAALPLFKNAVVDLLI